jgi:branched-chain amino acid transport system substrate-binding protein
LVHRAAIIAVAATTLALTACADTTANGSSSSESDSSPIEISAILSSSGGASFLGTGEQKSLEALQDHLNAQGGADGREVKFTFLDDQTTPAVAVQLARGLADDGDAAFIGPSLASTCGAVAPIVSAGDLVSYCGSPSVEPGADSFMFSSSVGSKQRFQSMLGYFADQGWTKVAYISANDATGQDGRAQLEASLPDADPSIEIVANESYEITDSSLAAQAGRIAEADPDVVIGWNSDTTFGTILSSLKQAGVTAPVITSEANMNLDLMSAYEAAIPSNLLFATSQWANYSLDETGPSADARTEWVSALSDAGLTPNATYSLMWDSANMVINAMASGATTATEVQDYINAQTEYVGILGTYDFSAGDQRGLTMDSVVIAQWDSSEKLWAPVSGPAGAPLE